MSCNGTANRGCWFPAGMSSFNFRTQPTPSPAYTAISVSAVDPRSCGTLCLLTALQTGTASAYPHTRMSSPARPPPEPELAGSLHTAMLILLTPKPGPPIAVGRTCAGFAIHVASYR